MKVTKGRLPILGIPHAQLSRSYRESSIRCPQMIRSLAVCCMFWWGIAGETTHHHAHEELESESMYPMFLLDNVTDVWKTQTAHERKLVWTRQRGLNAAKESKKKNRSKNAYLVLLHGLVLDTSYYRRYLVGLLIAKQAFDAFDSTADFIAMVGFGDSTVSSDPRVLGDIRLMEQHGIIVKYIPGNWFGNTEKHGRKVQFVEITLSKTFAWSLIDYRHVMLIDADGMPLYSLDCFFETRLDHVFIPGISSPLNAGWQLLTPNYADFMVLYQLATLRMQAMEDDLLSSKGWGPVPTPEIMGFDRISNWTFAGGLLEQGLFIYYFYNLKGSFALAPWNTDEFTLPPLPPARKGYVRVVERFEAQWEPLNDTFPTCDLDPFRLIPSNGIKHFYKKPWKVPVEGRSELVQMWFDALDALHIPGVTANNVEEYFNEFGRS